MLVYLIMAPAILAIGMINRIILLLYRVPYLGNVIINNLTLHARAMWGCRWYLSSSLLNMTMMSSPKALVVHFLMWLA